MERHGAPHIMISANKTCHPEMLQKRNSQWTMCVRCLHYLFFDYPTWLVLLGREVARSLVIIGMEESS